MAKISTNDREFLKLVARSPDRGDGWRSVSPLCWKLVEQFGAPELIEVDEENMRVRPTEKGFTVIAFAL